MITIKTKSIHGYAQTFREEAAGYQSRISAVDGCASWLRRQSFKEADRLSRTLAGLSEELLDQKEKLGLLSESLERICDRYEKAEERIVESGDGIRRAEGWVASVELVQIRGRLRRLGVRISK